MPNDFQHDDLLNELIALIAETLAVPESQVDGTLAYGALPEWDSLGHMNIMMALEAKYGITITTETITNLIDVNGIKAYIMEHKHA